MDLIDKFCSWFQVIAALLFSIFSIIYFIRSIFQKSEFFYLICFGGMLILSCKLFEQSVKELKEKKGDSI